MDYVILLKYYTHFISWELSYDSTNDGDVDDNGNDDYDDNNNNNDDENEEM